MTRAFKESVVSGPETTTGRKTYRPIRASLALFVAACALPGVLFSGLFIYGEHRQFEQQLTRTAIAHARALSATLDRDLASIESGLKVLAVAPTLAHDDLEGFYQNAKDALPSQNVNNFVLIDPDGRQRLNTLKPFSAHLPVLGGPPEIAEVVKQRKTVISDVFIGPVTGKPILAMGVPVMRGQQAVYSLNVGIFPERIAQLMRAQNLPDGWIGVIVDSRGIVISRTHDADKFVGKSAVTALIEKIKVEREGALSLKTLEGIEVISAFSHSSVSPWTVAIGIPKAELYAELRQKVILFLVLSAVVLSTSFALAWQFAIRQIAQPTNQLLARMGDLFEGKSPPAEVVSDNQEFKALESGLDSLAQRLADREVEQKHLLQRLVMTLETISDGFILLDPHWRYTYINRRAEELFGIERNTLLRLKWMDHPPNATLAGQSPLLQRVFDSGHAESFTLNMANANSTAIEGHVYKSDGGIAIYCRDISEQRQIELARSAQEAAEAANQAKNTFLSRVSHELRTPLNAVIGFAQVLQHDRIHPLVADQMAMAQKIEASGAHLLHMINDVLDISKAEAHALRVNLSEVNLLPLIDECKTILSPEMLATGVTVQWPVQQAALSVIADPVRLKQVLLNLVSNALKYNKPDGFVQVAIEPDGAHTHIRIIDQGLGMSPEQMAHLYEPFNRLGREKSVYAGTGIGLLITKNLLELMGSALTVESEEGIGSTFAFTLRTSQAQVNASKPPAPTTTARPQVISLYGERQVLYVEDNRSNCEIIGAMLAFRPQINLTYSHNCRHAKETLQKEAIDLILMDIHLPDGNGLELASWVYEHVSAQIPIIMVSADAVQLAQPDQGKAHIVASLSKPLDLTLTLATIDQWLSDPPPAQ